MTRKLVIDVESFQNRAVRASSGCLEWKGATSRGYGALTLQGKSARAHRVACELAHGPAPVGKEHALHHCDNRLCIEPDHLYWGDNADNARDRKARGRATGGRVYATHCVRGHEFTPENTYWEPRGWGRACKECRRVAVRRMRERRSS